MGQPGLDASRQSTGLALCGGGARGAYQLGVVEYLAKAGCRPSVIAGTSIGALNGSVLAAHDDLGLGVAALSRVWAGLGEADGYVELGRHLDSLLGSGNFGGVVRHFVESLTEPLLDTTVLERLVYGSVDLDCLQRGTKLWVPAFPLPVKPAGVGWILDVADTWLNRGAQWFCVQEFIECGQAYDVILASAAFPALLPTRRVRGVAYIDGGTRPADNTPIKPLASSCGRVVVAHAASGSLWNRHDWNDRVLEVIEIRPQRDLEECEGRRLGYFEGLLDFRRSRVLELQERGYCDAKRTFEAIGRVTGAVRRNRAATGQALRAVERLGETPSG